MCKVKHKVWIAGQADALFKCYGARVPAMCPPAARQECCAYLAKIICR